MAGACIGGTLACCVLASGVSVGAHVCCRGARQSPAPATAAPGPAWRRAPGLTILRPLAGALDVLQAVARADDRDAAWQAFVRLLAPHVGSDIVYSFGGAAEASEGKPARILLAGPAPVGSGRDPGSDDCCRDDPVRMEVRQSIGPVDWTDLEHRPGVRVAERLLWQRLRERGIVGGLSLPIHEPTTGRHGAVTIRARGDLADFRRLAQEHGAALQALALHFHGALQARAVADESRAAELSRREREVLAWVAGGLVTKAIGQRMGLSPRTVDVHIARAMRRLGARTRSEAASLAVLSGAVSP
jgi:DNA-binding CsgD family transcriptional regulator